MITKNDCVVLLMELKRNGVNVDSVVRETLRKEFPDESTLSFINGHRQLDLCAFYEKLRKSYNHKKSNLYINIVNEDNQKVQQEVLVTLASLQLQILLFSKTVENKEMFLRHARLEEISACLMNYSRTFDLIPCIKLLKVFKADLKVLESIYRNNKE